MHHNCCQRSCNRFIPSYSFINSCVSFSGKQQQVRELAQGQEQGRPAEERSPDHGIRHGWGHLLRVPGRLRSQPRQEVMGDLRGWIPHPHAGRVPRGPQEAQLQPRRLQRRRRVG